MRLKSIAMLGLCVWSLLTGEAAAQVRPAPETRAAAEIAQAERARGAAEAELPPPEVMLEIWQVPVARPYAVDEADMIRLGFEQELPAPGERSARRRAAELRASAALVEGEGRSRELGLRFAHAVVDHQQAVKSHEVHVLHLRLSQRTLELARARHAVGGALSDVSMAELEVARSAALVASDDVRAQTTRQLVEAWSGAAPPKAAVERAELTQLRLARNAELAEARAEHSRSGWPDFRVGASYFAPSGEMKRQGFGVSLGMKLPWLWGGRSGLQSAAESRARALSHELDVKKRDLAAELVQARGAMKAAQTQLQLLRAEVLPALLRARTLTQSAYGSGQSRLEDLLRAEALLVETEMEVVVVEAELAHRTADLEFALGSSEAAGSRNGERNDR